MLSVNRNLAVVFWQKWQKFMIVKRMVNHNIDNRYFSVIKQMNSLAVNKHFISQFTKSLPKLLTKKT